MFKEVLSLTHDLVITAHPNDVLHGSKSFRPFRAYQKMWFNYNYPEQSYDETESTWHLLQKYQMPFIKAHASSYHMAGIRQLDLDQSIQPDFNIFQKKFSQVANGFRIIEVNDEIEPREYFELIYNKQFPCIRMMRNHEEIFCANEPDFWHEAIGHIAPLCYKPVQDFYLQAAEKIIQTKSNKQFKRILPIIWTLMEYGFLKQGNKSTMFGAALVGSHLANVRYQLNLISLNPADGSTILSSGFYSEDRPAPKDKNGRFIFFQMNQLALDDVFNFEHMKT